ncbi:ABC transporter ATP-binding protein [Gorillibacterium timonense]|uniref:ABC transporter ATP-binding protein n=1 Tax=Gorillibacterium timonense TaxID=1689269 RepID=UPI00071DCC64|nr:ABC transporter ATP-binding protein [Gorillibacterium timonense]
MEKMLQIKKLAVSYHTYAGEVQAVRGISFDVLKGETVAIVGESGCGKSVTARAIMGLIQKPQGEVKPGSQILYKDQDIAKMSRRELRRYRGKESAIIFQDALSSLNPTMKVGKQIVEGLTAHSKISRSEARGKALDLLSKVGIPNPEKRINQYPHQFSGGMRQRVMIAIALACNPNLLIADEPTTALDVTIQAQILLLIKKLQKELGSSVIMITHDLGVVANMADRIVVMYAGRIVEAGTAEDIFYEPKHPYTVALLNAVPKISDEDEIAELEAIPGTPPDLIAPPIGCSFAARCKHCMEICVSHDPEQIEFAGEHRASCWLHHPDVIALLKKPQLEGANHE